MRSETVREAGKRLETVRQRLQKWSGRGRKTFRNGLGEAGKRSETVDGWGEAGKNRGLASGPESLGFSLQDLGRLCSSAEPAMVSLPLDAPTHLQKERGGGGFRI